MPRCSIYILLRLCDYGTKKKLNIYVFVQRFILFFLFEFDLLVGASSCLFKHDSKIWPFLIVTFTSYVHTITYVYINRLIIVCVRERKGERRKKKEKLNLKKQGGACYNQIMNKSNIIEKLYMQLVINIVQFPICNCLK